MDKIKNQTLEQTAKEESNHIIRKCGGCFKELTMSKEIYEKIKEARNNPNSENTGKVLNRQYNGFYVHGGWDFYCNKYCFDMFTES